MGVEGGNEPSSSWIAASVGFTLLLPLARFPFCAMLVERVTLRGPLPPTAVGLPTPSLYCVSFGRLARGAGTGTDGGSGWGTKWTLPRPEVGGTSSSSSVS